MSAAADPMAADELGRALALGGAVALALVAAIAAPLLARALTLADRIAILQLLAAKAVAGCVALAAALDQPALADAGLVLALLGAVAAAVFAQGARRGSR